MALAAMEITQTRIATQGQPNSPRVLALVAARLKVFWRSETWRSTTWRSSLWKSLVGRAGRRRKTLFVRETAALGDRRFVSVIQFERQRFLVGSSPSSITLLSPLPDEPVNGGEEKESKNEGGEEN